jgi:hypothetical protein
MLGHTFTHYALSEDGYSETAACDRCSEATDTRLVGIDIDFEGEKNTLSYGAFTVYTAAGVTDYYKTEGEGETSVLPYQTVQTALPIRSQLRTEALKYLGVRYVSGGSSPWGFDCSGLTQYLYRSVEYSIQRTVAGQLENGIIIAKEDLQCGDLVFFQNTTGYGHFASHVGIYIGNNQIVHAGDGGVGIADLDNAYFVHHYMCARRVVLTDPAGKSPLPAAGVTENINGSYWRESSQTNGSGNSFFPIFQG